MNKIFDGIFDRKNNKVMIFLNVKKFINFFFWYFKIIYFNVFFINIELYKCICKYVDI